MPDERENGEGRLFWGIEANEFPTDVKPVEEWEFYVDAKNSTTGVSDILQCRIDGDIARQVDELVQVAKEKGLHIKTRSDFLRFATVKTVSDMIKYFKVEDEGMNHFMLRQREAMKAAQQAEELTRIQKVTGDVISGLRLLTDERNHEWSEARSRLTSFLVPVMQMVGVNDFLVKMYIRALFGSKTFQAIVEKIRENTDLGPVIENAQKAYEKVNGGEGR